MKEGEYFKVRGKITHLSQRGLDGDVETEISLIPFKKEDSNVCGVIYPGSTALRSGDFILAEGNRNSSRAYAHRIFRLKNKRKNTPILEAYETR